MGQRSNQGDVMEMGRKVLCDQWQLSWSHGYDGWDGLTGGCMQASQESVHVEARKGGRGMTGTMKF